MSGLSPEFECEGRVFVLVLRVGAWLCVLCHGGFEVLDDRRILFNGQPEEDKGSKVGRG